MAKDSGYSWTLQPDDRLIYKADVRIEDTDNWSQKCDAIMSDGYRGWVSNRGERPVPWGQASTLSLVIDQDHRAALFVEYRPEDARWPSVVEGGQAQFKPIPYRGYSLCGFAFSPDGRSVAVVEFWGGADGALTVVDPARGDRRLITRIEGLSGRESPSWSPDGRWILIPTRTPILASADGATVVPLGTEDFPSGVSLDWWVEQGQVSLFGLAGRGLEQQVIRLHPATGDWEAVCSVRVPAQPGLEEGRHSLVWPRMAPGGDAVLVGSWLGPDGAYQEKYGSRSRLAVLHPYTGEVQSIFPAFVDDTVVERDHSGWHWTTTPRDASPLTVGGSLLSGSVEPDTRDREHDDDLAQRCEHLWGWWVAGAPQTPTGRDRLAEIPRLSSSARPAAVDGGSPWPAFVRSYRVHADFPMGADAFAEAQRAVSWMKSHGGHTFHGVMVDDQGNKLSPEWIDVSAGWLSSARHLAVITGTLTHSALGLEEAYDLGTFDGRNLPFGGGGEWGPTPAESLAMPNRQLFMGDPRTGRFRITDVGPDADELAVSNDGEAYATLEREGPGPRLLRVGTVASPSPRRTLATLDFATDLRFSPDGKYLGLISGGFALVDPERGQVARVPIELGRTTGWDWWPGSEPSILQIVYETQGALSRLIRIDLASGAAEQIAEIRVKDPAEPGVEALEPSLIRPRISPDGRWMLAMSRAFQSPGRESEYSERMGLVMVDLSDGSTQPMHDAFLDGPTGPFGRNVLTIDHQSHEWIPGAVETSFPALPDLRMDDLSPSALTPEQTAQLGEDALQIASLALEKAIGNPRFSGPGPGPLLPETVHYCVTAHATAEQWPQLDRWLLAVQSVLPEVAGQLPGNQRQSWMALVDAVAMIRSGRGGEIDYEALEALGRQ
jgi:hypothetical protein